MLSSMPRNSSAGISRRMAASTSSTSLAVSSMRVPLRARRCSRNWPASTDGKEVLPKLRHEQHRADAEREEDQRKGRAMVQHGPEQDAVALAETVEAPLEAGLDARRTAGSHGRDVRGGRRGRSSAARCGRTTSPASGPASATARSWPAWRTPPPRPAAQTGNAPRRSGRTSARTRCRCRASRRRPASRSPARRPESHRRAACPRPCAGGCSQWPPWRHPRGCRPPAPARPGSSG